MDCTKCWVSVTLCSLKAKCGNDRFLEMFGIILSVFVWLLEQFLRQHLTLSPGLHWERYVFMNFVVLNALQEPQKALSVFHVFKCVLFRSGLMFASFITFYLCPPGIGCYGRVFSFIAMTWYTSSRCYVS